jgi:3-dehydrosphinganine reductase
MGLDFSQQVALVTGGSSGIGLAAARLLAAAGCHVWLVARNHARLQDALVKVNAARRDTAQYCGYIAADISDPDQAAGAVQEVKRSAGVPNIIINSAGIVYSGYCEDLDLTAYRSQIEVNYLGAVYVIKAALPDMLARGSGYIVNVCSAAAFLGMFGYAAYGASKYALRGFSEVLRAELKPRGIHVSVVFPADTDTPQLAFDKATRPPEIDHMLGGLGKPMSPEVVAQAILNGMCRKKYIITPGFETSLFYGLLGLLGALQYPIMDFLVARAISQTQHGQDTASQKKVER